MKNSPIARIVLTCSAFLAFSNMAPLWAGSISFEFNQDGVLPSAQGAVYVGNVPETSAFSVSGGVLHQDTTSLRFDATAFYEVPGILNHSFDATLEWSARVLSSNQFGVQILVDSGGFQWNFILQDTEVLAYNGTTFAPIVAMNTTDAFHTYRVEIPANSTNYDFFVDGTLMFSGTAPTAGDSLLGWGDSTPTGGNGRADWGFVRLTNPESATVPEPATLTLLSIGTVAVIGYGWRRRKKAASGAC
jgi:PEP-CTERM motif